MKVLDVYTTAQKLQHRLTLNQKQCSAVNHRSFYDDFPFV